MDADEFDEFYSVAYGRLVVQLYAMTGSIAEAEDCVQEAFVKAWAYRSRLNKDHGPEAWVRLTAQRMAVSRWRRAKRALKAHEDCQSHGNSVEETLGPNHVALVQALKELPEPQRTAIVLFHIGDLSIQAISMETNTPVNTVKARLARGRSALAKLLNETMEAAHV